MKNTLLSLLFLLTFSLGLQAQETLEVPHTQMPVITKIAATWCPPCGSWGWTFFEHLLEDNSEKAVIFVAHHSGDLINEVASALTTNYGATYQPEYFVNGVDQAVTSGNTTAKRMEIKEIVDQTALMSPIAQTALEATYFEENINLNFKTEFFQSTSGAYYLGLYLVEKIVIADQAPMGSNVEHENIIRKELTNNNFGTLLASGDIGEGSTIEHSLTFPLNDYMPENLEIISIIWKKEGNSYLVLNANKDSDVEFAMPVATAFQEIEKTAFKVNPTIITNHANIDFRLNTALFGNISLLDVSGRVVEVLYRGILNEGQNSLDLTRSDDFPAGIYFVRLQIGDEVLSRKVVLK